MSCVLAQDIFMNYLGCFLIRNVFLSSGERNFGDFHTTIFKMLIPFGLYFSTLLYER